MIYNMYFICICIHLPNPIPSPHRPRRKETTERPLALPWATRLQQSFPTSPRKPRGIWALARTMMICRIYIQ